MNIIDAVHKINMTYLKAFGRTPLTERLKDIMGEALELQRYSDVKNLREEFGDILTSVIQGIHENGWDPQDLINENLQKIERRILQYQSLGRKIKVAIYGGAFDPITTGHVKVAQFILEASKVFDEVWLTPANLHLYNKSMQSSKHRIKMCQIATEHEPRIKVFPYEIENNLRGETFHFVVRLLEEQCAKDTYDFSLVIGQDNAETFHQWVNHEALERLIRFVVVPRKGITPSSKVDWYLKPPHIYLHGENDIPETSSSDVRRLIKRYYGGDPLSEELNSCVNPMVLDYALKNNLYK